MVENNTENLDPKVELEQQETVEAQTVAVEETVAPEEVIEEVVAPVEAAKEEVVAQAEEKAAEFAEPVVIPVAKKAKAPKVVVPEPAEFDWDALEEEDKGFSGRTKKDLETLYEKTLTTVQEKEVVEGRVISMNKREVVVDIGYK